MLHADSKRRVLSTEIINHILTEPRKFRVKNLIKDQLGDLFKNCLLNVVSETEAFNGSIVVIKKLLNMSSFVNEIELLIEIIIRKLENIQMPSDYKN